MAAENSFDVVSKIEMTEVTNAVTQAMKEISQRFDFKGSKSSITEEKDALVVLSDDEFKLKSVIDILQAKLVKRGVPIKNLTFGKMESALGGTVRQRITLQQGIPTDKAKEIVKAIKDAKMKVQASIQADQVRVSGKNRDELQAVIQLLKDKDFKLDLQFTNYRNT
ncbi:MAG: YajQ family cyclic di-GMP-binding protein [Nitrospirae bacterium GWD2_57_8]|nr:MAG: YajQ family cyclic di-GMP-binding protein [Nitrospirae bacterium GWD2_57_8]